MQGNLGPRACFVNHIIPLKITRHEGSLQITDADGFSLAYVYFRQDPQAARAASGQTPESAEEIAKVIARALTEAGRGGPSSG